MLPGERETEYKIQGLFNCRRYTIWRRKKAHTQILLSVWYRFDEWLHFFTIKKQRLLRSDFILNLSCKSISRREMTARESIFTVSLKIQN